MAASLGKHTKLTLTVTRLLLLDKNQRAISTCQTCFGNTWHVHDKPRRLREIYKAPDVDQKSVKAEVENIVIPDRIERSPTAVLEALASTVKNDVNQPMYMSIDDPHLYATFDRVKKNHLAAMDSGRKAARLMLTTYPECFTQLWDEPVPDFVTGPQEGYKHTDVSEAALLERIARRKVKDAAQVYKALKAAGQLPSRETQEKLLELLTVFNCQDQEPVSDLCTYVDDINLKKVIPFPASTWKKGNMAEQVFNSLPDKTARAYCNMLRGMAVNYEKAGAMSLYEEMKAANLTADVYTYNQLLRLASLETQSVDDIVPYVETLLRDMSANNIRPNEETFSSVLHNCRKVARWSGVKKYALSVMAEMRACGIEPSPTTYVDILNIFYYGKDKGPKRPELFEQILDSVMDMKFKCKTENDVLFFRTAMRVIAIHLPDSKLALKLHKLLKTGNNADLLGHRQLKYGYYLDLFSVIIPVEHIDVVMDLYQKEVPYNFFPATNVYKEILKSIQMYDSYGHVPRLYEDLQWASMFRDQHFMEPFVQTMANQKHDPQLQSQICDIASSLLKTWQERRGGNSRDVPHVDGSILGEFMIVYLDNNQLSKAWELFQLYLRDRQVRTADPSERALTKLTEHLIAEQDYTSTKEVLNQMSHLEYTSLPSMVEKSLQAFNLSDQERNYLQGLAADATSSLSSSSDSD